ncbi:MAG: SAM-dependent methyltransferase [Lachnospiraceae bacterium]|nr:SAM-dependent methyltransferase [Lachnospiraceae bacterium]
MKEKNLYDNWKKEEKDAHILGWDFSHIYGRYEEENDLPWDYEKIVKSYLTNEKKIMDYDTGGAEFLLSLNHPYNMTAATEGYEPNVRLCEERLLPFGVDFKKCSSAENIPFENECFDLVLNRHGDFNPNEIHRLLKKQGIFITEQVGSENDRDLVEMVLPGTPQPFPELNLKAQREKFKAVGFEIIRAEECFKPIKFYDVGAFVWFAHIIEWEFPNFSVDKCFDKLMCMQKIVDEKGIIEGIIHRYLIVAKK